MNIVTASRIAANEGFQDRVRLSMVALAVYKLRQATPPSEDVLLGQRILDRTETSAQWADAVVMEADILAGAHDEAGSSITDSEINTATNALWAVFVQ